MDVSHARIERAKYGNATRKLDHVSFTRFSGTSADQLQAKRFVPFQAGDEKINSTSYVSYEAMSKQLLNSRC